MKLERPTSDQSLSELIYNVAQVFPKRKTENKTHFELSLASKFLHFLYPKFSPPFDQFAYTALRILAREYGCRLAIKHPRDNGEIEKWLYGFRKFHSRHEAECTQICREITSTIPVQDKKLATYSITTCKICDLILWEWGK